MRGQTAAEVWEDTLRGSKLPNVTQDLRGSKQALAQRGTHRVIMFGG